MAYPVHISNLIVAYACGLSGCIRDTRSSSQIIIGIFCHMTQRIGFRYKISLMIITEGGYCPVCRFHAHQPVCLIICIPGSVSGCIRFGQQVSCRIICIPDFSSHRQRMLFKPVVAVVYEPLYSTIR